VFAAGGLGDGGLGKRPALLVIDQLGVLARQAGTDPGEHQAWRTSCGAESWVAVRHYIKSLIDKAHVRGCRSSTHR